jgi:predicted metalloprotease with PDZ domain
LRSEGKGSLDDVMRHLWEGSAGGPVSEDDIARALHDVAGRSMRAELDAWVHGCDDLPLPALLDAAGVDTGLDRTPFALALGLHVLENSMYGVHVKTVLRGSAAETAGIAVGDELLAVNGWRTRRLDEALAWLPPNAPFEVLLTRNQRLMTRRVTPSPYPVVQAFALRSAGQPPEAALALKKAWLYG